jgi:tRNA A37 N6-isopentenylltransferase MiaA
MTKEPLIILTGPTAVGKTALSLSLAERVNGEIISADSMQVYRGMDIGSAKIMPEEQKGIPHHLIDVLDPDEEFHVVRFVQMAKEAMEDIRSRGKVPILTGGTGFYIQAMLYDIDFTESGEDDSYRRELETYAKEQGAEKLKEKGCHRGMVSMQGLGYKEILEYLDGECTLEEAVYKLKRDTRHFAKRQITWFKRERDVIWVDKDAFEYDEEKILQYMLAVLQERHVWNH